MLSIALLVFSIFIALFLAEFAVRALAQQNLSGSWRITTDKGLSVNKSFGKARHQLGERIVNYIFYEPHLRDTPIQKKGIKILVLGDSFAFGWLVKQQYTFVQLLQDNADNEYGSKQFQFLNASAAAWGTADYVAYVEDFGELINPDIVLVFLNSDDIGRSLKKNIYTISNNKASLLKRNRLASSTLKKLANEIPGYQWLLENSHLLQLTRTAILTLTGDIGDVKREKAGIATGPISLDLDVSRQSAIMLGTSLFSHLNKWCREHDSSLWVVSTGWHNLDNAKTTEEPTQAFMSIADEYFNKEHIPFIDTSLYMSEELANYPPEKYMIVEDGHPNESGHQLIGNTAWQYFIKDQLSEYCRKTKRCSGLSTYPKH